MSVAGWVYFDVFFEAEDGIRFAQESRGLGDVYKRQVVPMRSKHFESHVEKLCEMVLAGDEAVGKIPNKLSLIHI